MGGAGLALFDAEASGVSCTLNVCTVDWAFTSTWLFDDIDDVHVLTTAIDEAGLEVGPEVYVRKTAFNEVENDLEVVDFTVTDTQQRRIDDWTNSFWPFHLEANESLLASGRVRMEGVANRWVEAGEAEATVTYERFHPRTSRWTRRMALGGREVVPFVDGGSGGRWLVHRGGFNTVGRRRGPQQHLP